MLPQVRVEPRASDFYALHATVCANSLFAGSLKTFRSLYSYDLLIPKNSLSQRIPLPCTACWMPAQLSCVRCVLPECHLSEPVLKQKLFV